MEDSAMTGAMLGSMMNGNNTPYAALMANGGMNNWMNNPFAYLMFLPFMYGMTGNGGWGNNGRVGQGLADVGISNQIQNLSNQVADNQNSNLTMGTLNNINGAVRDNGIALNAGVDSINQGVNNVGFQVQNTGCGIKTAILEQGYQNQLGNCQQTNTILQQAQNLTNTVQNGFTNIGYQLATNACEVKQNSTDNTQKIVDTLNNHWNLENQTTIQQLRDEIGRLNQTTTLIAALGGTTAATKSTTNS